MNKSNEIVLNTPILGNESDFLFLTPDVKLNEKSIENLRSNDNYKNSKSSSYNHQKSKTPTNKVQPKNKNRRSFTPCHLNQLLQSPEVSPIENNLSLKSVHNLYDNQSMMNNEFDSIYANSTFLEDSLLSSSPTFLENQFKEMKTASKSFGLMLPPKKTSLRRVCTENMNTVKYGNSANKSFSSKALTFTSTPSLNINHSDGAINYDSIGIDINLANLSNCGRTLNFSSWSSNGSDSIDLNDMQLTPKTSLNERVTVSSILIGMGLEKYLKNFDNNITYDTFMNLNNSDLIKYGIKSEKDRDSLLKLINVEMESPC